MRKGIFFVVFLGCSKLLWAQNEVGPEGEKLLWVVVVLVIVIVASTIGARYFSKTKSSHTWFVREKVNISLEKDALYYPDYLTLKVKNTGNTDIDLGQPLLVFDNFWLKRKFKLKGMANRNFYPLYLEKGSEHSLHVDLNRFYRHDKRLKRFPKVKVYLRNVKGKRLGSRAVYLRKTLFKW